MEQRYQAVLAILTGDPVVEVAEKAWYGGQGLHADCTTMLGSIARTAGPGHGARIAMLIRHHQRLRSWCELRRATQSGFAADRL